jgi:hypothetical protein
MKVILSFPYIGALYWWMQKNRSAPALGAYYRHLFGRVEEHLDLALANIVIFDEIVTGGADTFYPESREKRHPKETLIPSIGLTADWEATRRGYEIVDEIREDLIRDSVIRKIIRNVPAYAKAAVLEDAVIDAILLGKYRVPLISAPGRKGIIDRLIQLGVVTKEMLTGSSIFELGERPFSFEESQRLTDSITDYVNLTALTFASGDVESLARVKSDNVIRDYAQEFQRAVILGDNSIPLDQLVLETWRRSQTSSMISKALAFGGRGLSFASLFPGGAPVAAPGVAMDWLGVLVGQNSRRNSWYEFGPQIKRLESINSLESKMRRLENETVGPAENYDEPIANPRA